LGGNVRGQRNGWPGIKDFVKVAIRGVVPVKTQGKGGEAVKISRE